MSKIHFSREAILFAGDRDAKDPANYTAEAREHNRKALGTGVEGVSCTDCRAATHEEIMDHRDLARELSEDAVVTSTEVYANGALNLFVRGGPGRKTIGFIRVRPYVPVQSAEKAEPPAPSLDEIRAEVTAMFLHIEGGDQDGYSQMALRFFDHHRLIILPGIGSVETWFDRGLRSYVTQAKDLDGNQVGEGKWAGNRSEAALNHTEAVRDALRPKQEPLKDVPMVEGVALFSGSKELFPLLRERPEAVPDGMVYVVKDVGERGHDEWTVEVAHNRAVCVCWKWEDARDIAKMLMTREAR